MSKKSLTTGTNERIDFELAENGLSVDFKVFDAQDNEHVIYDGYVKKDGCVNWRTGPGRSYAHFCDYQALGSFCAIFAMIWMEAKELMPNADY